MRTLPLASLRPLAVAALVLLLAFAFLGMRGLWEPDEGRYTNVALMMLDRGDWLTPMRNDVTGHFTKPPMTYWLIAASVSVFGQDAWAARLPIALAFVACAGCVWWIARHWVPGREARATVVFATMLAPCLAAQLVTTDMPLAAAEALAMACYVQARFGDARWRAPAWVGMWAAFGLAFLIKGPPGLLPLLAIGAHASLVRGPRIGMAWHGVGLLAFAAIALPWYAMVVSRHEGLLDYFLGAEVLDRVASDRFQRNGEWYGWAKIYVPMLLVGTLPWTGAWWRWWRGVASRVRAWRDARARACDAHRLLLVLWIVLPLLVFCIARSRLPLYVLPLFVPIALAVACALPERLPRWPWFAAWVAVLLGVRIVAAHWPTQIDAAAWAEAITARVDAPVRRVVFVEDKARWGLHLHLDAQVERHSREARDEPAFGRGFDAHFATALATGAVAGTVYVVPVALWEELQAVVEAEGFIAHAHGEPHLGRQVFGLRPSR
jgi:4-amino-4-deoxy-L-arabinose transferase-like glycosyltransferase